MSDLSDSWLGEDSLDSNFNTASNELTQNRSQNESENERAEDEIDTDIEDDEVEHNEEHNGDEGNSQDKPTNAAKSSKESKEVIKNANELLNYFEEEHRHDLTLHLYSSYLLKKLIYSAHEKKNYEEVDVFLKTQMRDNWVSWPNPKVIIDPQLDQIYEDVPDERDKPLDPVMAEEMKEYNKIERKKISETSFQHAKKLMKMELNAHWEHTLQTAATKSETNLDIEHLNIPDRVSEKIFTKLDDFFAGMHARVAKMNKFEVIQDSTELKLSLVQKENSKVKPNKRIKFDYHDIISRGSEMGDDMRELYMKSLELYNDIPSKFDKHQFKVPPEISKKYSKKFTDGNHEKYIDIVTKMKYDEFVPLEVILNDSRLTNKDKSQVRRIYKKEKENTSAKKSFFYVQGYQGMNDKDSDYSEDDYTLDDCLIKIPRRD